MLKYFDRNYVNLAKKQDSHNFEHTAAQESLFTVFTNSMKVRKPSFRFTKTKKNHWPTPLVSSSLAMDFCKRKIMYRVTLSIAETGYTKDVDQGILCLGH